MFRSRFPVTFLLFLFVLLSMAACVDSNESADDSRLRLIRVSEGSLDPAFSFNQTLYQLEVDANTENIQVTAFARNLGAFIRVNNTAVADGLESAPINLLTGKNEIEIGVISRDGSSQSRYLIEVFRGVAPPDTDDGDSGNDGDAAEKIDGLNLGLLQISGIALDQVFQAEQLSYTATVGTLVDSVRVIATAAPENQLLLNGELLVSGERSKPVAIADGSNKIEITVSSADAPQTQTYSIEVNRKPISEFSTQAIFAADTPENGSQYGFATSVFGQTIAIAAPQASAGRGAVFIYQKDVDGWRFSQQLTLSDARAGDRFGQSLSLQEDLLAVGAMQRDAAGLADSGEVYIYQRTGNGWVESAKLSAAAPQAGHRFGFNVALSESRLAVATLRGAGEASDSGEVSVFNLQGTSWALDAVVGQAGVGASDKYAASLDLEGDWLAVGSFNQQNCLRLNDNDPGSVRVYQRIDGSGWSQFAQLNGEGSTDRFGFSVDLDKNRLAVGAQCEDEFHTTRTEGAVYIYEKTEDSFRLQQKIKAFSGAAFGLYGDRVAFSGDQLVVTGSYEIPAHHSSSALVAAGAAYLLEQKNNNWQETRLFLPNELESNDRFGISLSVSGGRALIGAPGGENNTSLFKNGAVYLFE